MEGLAERVGEVHRRIAASGGTAPGRNVTLVAVTKGFGPEVVRAALHCGLHDLGENYAQELAAKMALPDGGSPAGAVRWHHLGRIQRRQVRRIAGQVHLWQSLDRLAAGQAIARAAPGAAVLVQVNVSGRPGRNGCGFDEAGALVGSLRACGLDVRGLMAVGGPGDPRQGFRRLAELGQGLGLKELSMGMSSDLEVAVEEGATMVRIGAALFGPRPAGEDLRRYSDRDSDREGGW